MSHIRCKESDLVQRHGKAGLRRKIAIYCLTALPLLLVLASDRIQKVILDLLFTLWWLIGVNPGLLRFQESEIEDMD